MMQRMEIQRDARVMAADGEVGRVRHVVVDPETREVTDIVVRQDGNEWLVPISAVAGVDDDGVRLRGAWSEFQVVDAVRRGQLEPVTPEEAREAAPGRPAHGGAPLLDAREDAVEVGGARPMAEAPAISGDTVRMPRPDLPATAPPVAEETGSSLETAEEQPYRLQLKEERLRITKEQEQAGTVRVRKRVIERLETVSVPVREEYLIVEHVAGTGIVRVGDRELREGESIELAVLRERVHVTKDVIVSEDVIIRKESFVRTEQVEETVRKEDIVVDSEGDLAVDEQRR